MEDLTRERYENSQKNGCPNCGEHRWYGGPEGGMCKNYTCANCELVLNICAPGVAQIVTEGDPTLKYADSSAFPVYVKLDYGVERKPKPKPVLPKKSFWRWLWDEITSW